MSHQLSAISHQPLAIGHQPSHPGCGVYGQELHYPYTNNNEEHSMTTADHLKEAFAGESQANQKYRAFAAKAEKEGLPNIAKLFRTTAEAERIHAAGHLASMEGIGSTAENLKSAIAGETYEFTEMYPPMLEQAKIEGHKSAARMFNYALTAEAVHAKLYALALAAAEAGKDLTEVSFYLCPVCGNIEFGNPPEECPICGLKGDKFMLVD
jgi:rubrerythrin